MTAPECRSCHATDGRPHTEYCQLTQPLADTIEVRDPESTMTQTATEETT